MADKTMPPNDPMPTQDAGTGMAPESNMAPEPAMPSNDGSVMISMPKVAFDAIHQLITQLAQGVDNLSQSVNDQASGGSMPPAPEATPSPSPAGSPSDEDFLNSVAEAGSQR